MRTFEVKLGDIIRLREPFKPEYFGFQKYSFAIVAGVVTDGFRRSRSHQSISDFQQIAEGYPPKYGELVVYLYEPNSSSIYVDQFGVKALFSFSFDEIELCSTLPLERQSDLVRQ